MDFSELSTTAEMAMLELDEAQFRTLASSLERLLSYVACMQTANVDGVEPTTHPLIPGNRLRADQSTASFNPDALLEQAPEVEERFITVPNVL